MPNMQDIKDLIRDGQPRNNWRLRTIGEETTAAIQEDIVEGETYFKSALRYFNEGNREAAIAALKAAVSNAEKAVEAIEG